MRHAIGFLICICATAQTAVTIHVDARKSLGAGSNAWSYFGYDEPNYTTAPNGRKLIDELVALSATPVSIRVHNLLTTGNGEASLKWGSTNAYTVDANGKARYDWTIVDEILDTFVDAGAQPFVEIGFMPEALSTHPEPYRHHFPAERNVFTGWSYPPTDYEKWGELVHRWAQHCAEKYGRKRAESWQWEVWNEPNIAYWHGTAEEYDRLYDVTANAVRKALPRARVGGPATTGPGDTKAAAFLKQFLEHCESGRNAATGGTGAPLDFISFHAKGSPKIDGGEVTMGLAKQLRDMREGFRIVASSARFAHLPIVLSESDPEGCAACAAPQNAYRNGTLYATYMAASQQAAVELARQAGVKLQGFLTWAFEFEDQPYFAGLRTLATNGVDQPVLNVFRMYGLMRGNQVEAISSGRIPVEQMLESGVPATEVDAIATRDGHTVSVMVWNYEDRDRTSASAEVALSISGLPDEANRVLMRHYRVDGMHSNSYEAWKRMGSPQKPTAAQAAQLVAAGQLGLLDSPRYLGSDRGGVEVRFQLPEQGISLVQFTW